MKIKKETGKKLNKMLLIGIFLIMVQGVVGEETQTLQSELNNLTSYLDEQGYNWLINYSIILIMVHRGGVAEESILTKLKGGVNR